LNALESALDSGIPIAEAVELEMPDRPIRGKKRYGREHQRERITKLLRSKDSLSVRQIANEIGCSPETVQRQKERLDLKKPAPRRKFQKAV
jgi:DNA-binding CsgD family transcriptional regulator